ncbi:tyrosine-type recombinase/integrase [Mycobacterium paraintracellulare]|uniref:tyrosine-type recombinase/integrase n=1 Tax=Mycobacterium paraintracellulare TaxID=1138383 RepID=UPI001EEF69E9|nr:tyrosine-type recombinase/integrase [Mycobacterium paraintracellulare]
MRRAGVHAVGQADHPRDHKWRPAVAEAKLPAGTGFHALRHYYASLLIRHGESVKTVQARLGHASAVETLDTYSHLWPDSDDRTRDAIDSVLGSTASENVADQLRTVEELTL